MENFPSTAAPWHKIPQPSMGALGQSNPKIPGISELILVFHRIQDNLKIPCARAGGALGMVGMLSFPKFLNLTPKSLNCTPQNP